MTTQLNEHVTLSVGAPQTRSPECQIDTYRSYGSDNITFLFSHATHLNTRPNRHMTL